MLDQSSPMNSPRRKLGAEAGISSVAAVSHSGLGAMLRLSLGTLSFDLTLHEARTLAKDLAAVRAGYRLADAIYLSPIASEGDFSAEITPQGLVLRAPGPPLHINWLEVGAMAACLAGLAEYG
jgi:hypothetical protein